MALSTLSFQPPKRYRCSSDLVDNALTFEMASLAWCLEEGLRVARDIGGSDPERMSSKNIVKYLENELTLPVKMTVSPVDEKAYPMAAIVDRGSNLKSWTEDFEKQFSWPPASGSHITSPSAPWSVSTDQPTEAEVRKELQVSKRHKAPGTDTLPPALFKDGGGTLTMALTGLFRKVWETDSAPSIWNEAIIVPIFKRGRRNSCDNHRGISLLPVASKI
ncbi:unnamed protein product, partial [Trichobilharzia regenti]